MKNIVTEMQVREKAKNIYSDTRFNLIFNFHKDNPNAWPFVEPVSGVADYYDIIKEPMGKWCWSNRKHQII